MCSIIEKTSLGWVGVSCSRDGLTGVILPQKTRQDVLEQLVSAGDSGDVRSTAYLQDFASRLKMYFEGKNVEFPDKLDYSGATELQKKVWEEARRIPYGKTSSYGEVAGKIGCRSARAVGQALGRNPFPVIVPCHRVIGSNGKLVGFAGGLKLKEQMLKLEKAI
ncbi:MAG: hypothetical protein A2Z02_05135 [Chloroflexi bacterium RBG_16_48_7]|nr:MAG: hypothetical protein A2Z02_05135 [Chloroflexi bacterium RBG_16_48_7]